ncbi:hypothetical protein [Candidatus Reidiella endopervernicosa]|uniref:Uncharacterized protein n=1 Tax=Candidatus Reidiella endopervernicosa TaxID=2738883 RepID=A0A6N0HXX1_9GAMM|nr:hypothetical protein [Candidatus Reidiella endopervernicosa]QKQ27200.1 hypothetical protein HUE57_13570 [Candidatus Reidiella endopervernicosa]
MMFSFWQRLPIQGLVRAIKNNDLDPSDGSTKQQWRERLEQIFVRFVEAKPDYKQIRYIGVAEGGREIVRIERLGEDLGIVAVVESRLPQKDTATTFKKRFPNL